MNKNELMLQLALDQLSNLYQEELLSIDFFQVLQHKAASEDLKWHIFGQIHLIQERSKHLKVMLSHQATDVKSASCAGIRGVLQSGLKLIHHYEDEKEKDVVLIHVLLLIHHYKLGIYQHMMAYFRAGRLETEVGFIQKYVLEEKQAIEVLGSTNSVLKPSAQIEKILS